MLISFVSMRAQEPKYQDEKYPLSWLSFFFLKDFS